MFEVDADGFKEQQAGRNPARLVAELIANGFDEPTAKIVQVDIIYMPRRKAADIRVEDDGDGFRRLQDIYTLFGRSDKVGNPQLRGRFNLGEKQFLAACDDAVVTTAGTILVFRKGRRTEHKAQTLKGTTIQGIMPLTKLQVENLVKRLQRIIVPADKRLVINGETMPHRKPLKVVFETLPTVIGDGRTNTLRNTERRTGVEVFEPQAGEKGWLYEMGMPVQGIDAPWHVNVGQKVPLNPNRDTVRESYLDKIYTLIVNEMHDDIPDDSAGNVFVERGLRNATLEAAKDMMEKRYGTDKIYFASGDEHSNEHAMENGHLIGRGELDGDTRRHLEEMGVVQYAANAFPTTWTIGKPLKPTPAMERYAKVVREMAMDAIGHDIDVRFVNAPDASDLANYGGGILTYNVANMGTEGRFETFRAEDAEIAIHELAHDKEIDGVAHLSMDFVNEVCRVAGVIAMAGVAEYKRRAGWA